MTGVWNTTPVRLSPSDKYIDVWRTSLNLPPAQVDSYRSVLSVAEIKRANRFKVKRKYFEYIISRGMLRRVLGLVLNRDPSTFEFGYTEHDKPYLNINWRGEQVYFNVSHSHEQTLIAVTLARPVGIDIEQIRQDVEFKKLAKRFFSAAEARDLDTYTDSGIALAFFSCWTRKEAFVKALGDGIAFGLSEFSVSVNPFDGEVALSTHWDPDEARKWTLVNIRTDADYAAALAVPAREISIRYWE